jgi:hypothetical protein
MLTNMDKSDGILTPKAEETFKALLLGLFLLIQGITYPMAIVRWFMTDQLTFWRGFKELIWALVPIANIAYVWDWWAIAVMVIISHFKGH